MSKQDRQGVRTPADLERKYPLGKLNSQTGDTSEISRQINQLNQSMSMFMASTNGSIEELSGEVTEQGKDVSNLEQSVADLERAIEEFEPGGVGSSIVTVLADSLNTETLSADKTFAEIEASILAGFDVKAKLIINDSNVYLQMSAYLPGSEIDFCGYYYGGQVLLQIFADEEV